MRTVYLDYNGDRETLTHAEPQEPGPYEGKQVGGFVVAIQNVPEGITNVEVLDRYQGILQWPHRDEIDWADIANKPEGSIVK